MDGIWRELDILLVSFALGVGLTLVYDLIRLARGLVRRGWLLIGLEDVLFWLLAALCFTVMSLQKNDGVFRWYMIAAAVAGGYFCLFLEKLLKNSYYLLKKWLHSRQK